jgi:hypothetical protein
MRVFGRSLGLCLVLLVLLSGLSHKTGTIAQSNGETENVALLATPALKNAGFDNHDWYEFNNRYGHYLAGSWLPDDDDNLYDTIPLGIRQDWRVWFMDGWGIPEVDPEQVYIDYIEAVQIRTYGSGSLLGGIYQPIYDVTPCLWYEFSMKGQSRPEEAADTLIALQIGIDRVGWILPTTDPAVHGSFPSTTVWSTAQQYQWKYGTLSVSAEAWANKLTVYTYAHADGGRSHRILWDTGTFQEVTPPTIYDPLSYASTGGISAVSATPGSGSALVSWTTTDSGIGQVFYHVKSAPAAPPSTLLSYTVFLPFVARPENWLYSDVNKTAATAHQVTLTNLESGYTYEYFVVSRGLSGNQCISWVSEKKTFVVP